jgi:hypothetical protein
MSALQNQPTLTSGSGTSTGERPALVPPLRVPLARRSCRIGSDLHDKGK